MKKYGTAGGAVVLTVVVLEIFAAHTVEIWLWAMVYNLIGEITDFESALYFSTVTFTTLGYGDITISEKWRLLSSLEAVKGILLFGWNTVFIFTVITRIWTRTGRMPS